MCLPAECNKILSTLWIDFGRIDRFSQECKLFFVDEMKDNLCNEQKDLNRFNTFL